MARREVTREATRAAAIRDQEPLRGRFWAISEDQEEGAPSEEDLELRSPATSTLADALGCAKEKRSKQRKGRKAELKEISGRIRAEVRRKTSILSADARPFFSGTGVQRVPAVVEGIDPYLSDSDGSDWFQIVRGRPIRLPSRTDSAELSTREDARSSLSLSRGSAPAISTSLSPARLRGNPGDDVSICVGGTHVSIRTLGRYGPRLKRGMGLQDEGVREEAATRVSLQRSAQPLDRTGHLHPLLSHLWCSTRAAAATDLN